MINRAAPEYHRTAAGTPLPSGALLWRDVAFVLRFQSKLKRVRYEECIGCLEALRPDEDWSGWRGDCFVWGGRLHYRGYGQFRVRRKDLGVNAVLFAHRVGFMIAHGRWPHCDLLVRHLCGERSCCNPLHLLEGTREENEADRKRGGMTRWRWKNQHSGRKEGQ
jgi:hypothetical protein